MLSFSITEMIYLYADVSTVLSLIETSKLLAQGILIFILGPTFWRWLQHSENFCMFLNAYTRDLHMCVYVCVCVCTSACFLSIYHILQRIFKQNYSLNLNMLVRLYWPVPPKVENSRKVSIQIHCNSYIIIRYFQPLKCEVRRTMSSTPNSYSLFSF